MAFTVLLTGFGPFPGAPVNPTGPLVRALARRSGRYPQGTRRIAHVFETSYAAVDRELPVLLKRIRPQVLIMFGLAQRSPYIRIETRARNALGALPDAAGHRPAAELIAPETVGDITLPAPVQRLLSAARSAGLAAALSHDAGSYLCNYLCWRACEAAGCCGSPGQPGLRATAFVHVPHVAAQRRRAPATPRARGGRPPSSPDDLLRAAEAAMRITIMAARIRQ
jgi:pyroglutamyl-peptidase